jgi:hypothetical protein
MTANHYWLDAWSRGPCSLVYSLASLGSPAPGGVRPGSRAAIDDTPVIDLRADDIVTVS